MKLYELSNQYEQVAHLLEQDDADHELLESTLEAIGESLDAKAENIAKLVRKYEAESEAIKVESKRLNERAAKAMKNADKLKEYISDNLQRAGIAKVEGKLFTLSFRKSTQVNVTDFDKLPDDFKLTKTEVVADKKAIGERLKDGEVVEGAELITNQNLQIK